MKNINYLLKRGMLALAAIPGIASAWDFESGGIYYDVVSHTELTCAVAKGPDGAYTGNIGIPATTIYNNRELKVVGINDEAFRFCEIESVSGCENVNFIGELAFSECNDLLKFDCPETLEHIGEQAFYHCSILSQVTFNENLKSIARAAFQSSGITSAVLPKAVTELGADAFAGCSNLEFVTLPESIERIDNNTFGFCSKLLSITIPSSVKTIGKDAFHDSGLTELKGGESVKTIERDAFNCCNSLISVNLGVNLKQIQTDAFKKCGAIKTINSYAPAAPELQTPWDSKVYINATLNIMEGTKAAYANSTNWVEFWNVQDNIPNNLSIFSFLVTATTSDGNGKVLINGEDKTDSYAVGGSDLTFTFIPDFGYKVEQVIVNGTDMTSEVTDNNLVINGVKENIYAAVTYSQIKVALSISTADSGTVTMDTNYGSQHTFTITPAEGWAVHSVMFNNEDVTTQVDGNTYTSPAITVPSEIRVIFEDDVNSIETVNAQSISLSTNHGIVKISGASDYDKVRVYSLNGVTILNTSDKVFSLPTGTAYIINVAGRSFKIIP